MPEKTGRIHSALLFETSILQSHLWIVFYFLITLSCLFCAPTAKAVEYYVNDDSTNLDEWCTGVGDNANDGLTPGTPKATLQSIIDNYDLEPGDSVHIDTGNYILIADIEITESDQGEEGAPVTIEASPYGVVIDRNSVDISSVFELSDCDYVTIRTVSSNKYPNIPQAFMKLTGGWYGLYLHGADHCIINRVEVAETEYRGIITYNSHYVIYLNNLIHKNGVYGFSIDNSDNNKIINNTIVRNGEYAPLIDHRGQVKLNNSQNVVLKNNIICSYQPICGMIFDDESAISYSDYNLIYTTINGAVIESNDKLYFTLEEWKKTTNRDLNSFSVAPRFLDEDKGDYHLKSTGGSYQNAIWVNDSESSPGIDNGDPLDEYSSETLDNGNHINLGAYGGTEQASKSPSGRELFYPVLIGGEVLAGNYEITWMFIGQGWQTGDTVKIEYSIDNGLVWNKISESVPVEDEYYLWDTTLFPNYPSYKIRITSNEDQSVYVESDGWFYVHNGPIHYYVNDASTDLDEWCTGVGYDTNGGITPATPKATVQAVLDAYDLMSGDIVHIDTGNYILLRNIEITESDQGKEGAPIIIEASPYGVIINRNSTSSGSSTSIGSHVFYLNNSAYITIRTAKSSKYPDEVQYFMKLTGSYSGIGLNRSGYCTIARIEIFSNSRDGINAGNSSDITISNNLIYDNGYLGIRTGQSSLILNNTIAKNGDSQVHIGSSLNVILKNNILWTDGSRNHAISSTEIIGDSDYNLIYATNGAAIGYYDGDQYTLTDWQNATKHDLNSFSLDPKFVDPEDGDYHLKSTGGSYHNRLWTGDEESSQGIDVGDPLDAYGNEPPDNGDRINIGAFGGTEQASKSPLGRKLFLPFLNDGEVIQETYEIKWFAVGQDWQTGDTVKIEYSNDNGNSWHVISESVLAEIGYYLWNTTSLPDKPYYKVRITCNEDANVYIENNGWFYVHNGPIHYYVNDGSIALDEWCTRVGDNANDGLTPATPKASVPAVLDTYELEPGDVVYIDTGNYTLTTNIEVSESDQGVEIAPVLFAASPYGVIIDRNSADDGYVFHLDNSDYVIIRTVVSSKYPDKPQSFMKLTGGHSGILLSHADYCTINRLEVSSNSSYGINANGSESVVYSNNLINNNGHIGIVYLGQSSILINNTIVKNTNTQVYIGSVQNVTMKNNIIWADGVSNHAISSSGIFEYSDYNLIYATNGSYIGDYPSGNQSTLADWQTTTGVDLNSLSIDPGFVDLYEGDYHLKSTEGSYHGGEWIADNEDSPGIDTGDLIDDYSYEPVWNGHRINLGAFGGTEQASKSQLDDNGDFDGDGLPNWIEKDYCTDVFDSDTDNDGISDGYEDINYDGLVNTNETNPCDYDTDDDGMPDGWEGQYNLDPLFDDADEDFDGDGFSNIKEYQESTYPNDYHSHPPRAMPWLQLLLGDD